MTAFSVSGLCINSDMRCRVYVICKDLHKTQDVRGNMFVANSVPDLN